MSLQTEGSRNIDDLLRSLREATGMLNESLEVMLKPEHRAESLTLFSSKNDVVRLLMKEVEHRYGIAPGEQVERKLLRIFAHMSFDDLEFWCRSLLSLNSAEAEWLSLVECLTVHETYFDRDKDQLNIVTGKILPALIERKVQTGDFRLRIWSAGCSSGEETYNLAMLVLVALKKAGYACEQSDGSLAVSPLWDISVLGSDVSSQMIRVARDFTYATGEMGSFRNMDPLLWRFFEESTVSEIGADTGRIMRVKPCVSRLTRFRRHNLLEPLQEPDRFDLILCRNVMIYFSNANKIKVQERLCQNLSAEGVLLLGATDTLLCRTPMERHQTSGNFWYRHHRDMGLT